MAIQKKHERIKRKEGLTALALKMILRPNNKLSAIKTNPFSTSP